MPPDLAAFITERLDEAERNIAYAGPARIAWLTYLRDDGQMDYTTVAARHEDFEPWCADGRDLPEPASVRIMHDPERERRGVEAKRAILARYERACRMPEPAATWTAGQDDGYRQACEDALRDLAAEWSDHPDYPRDQATEPAPAPQPPPRCACCSAMVTTCGPGFCDSCCDSRKGCIGECVDCDGRCPATRVAAEPAAIT